LGDALLSTEYSHISHALLQLGDLNAGVVDEAEQLLQAMGDVDRLGAAGVARPALQVSEASSLDARHAKLAHNLVHHLKGLSHETFTFFWQEWIYLSLYRNRFWFFSSKEIPSIVNNQFKYCCISYQT
jgi:hypothetical protein